MKLHLKLALVTGMLALGLAPAAALGVSEGHGPEYHPEHPTAPKGHAYGYYCKGQSKKHVEGLKRTPFAECVRAAKKADHNENLSPKKACKALKNIEGKHKPHGEKGTAFSRCVKGVAQMRKEEA